MKRLLAIVALMALAGLLVGCEGPKEPLKDQFQQLGLLGQHDLRRIEQTSGFSGYLNGHFGFFGGGSVSGRITSEQQLQFFWGRTPEEFFSTTLPYSMFRFVIDDAKTVPTIEFIFDEYWLDMRWSILTEGEKANLNRWLDNYNYPLHVAVVRISREDLEKEIYLPRQ